MKYSKTGQFTANQEKLCKEIAIRISKVNCAKAVVVFSVREMNYVYIKQKIWSMHNHYIFLLVAIINTLLSIFMPDV